MIVIETLAFTRRVMALMSDDEYTAMQWFLRFKPDAGVIIRLTGGARKLRWGKKEQGKRGGCASYTSTMLKKRLCGCWLFMRKKKKRIYQNPKVLFS